MKSVGGDTIRAKGTDHRVFYIQRSRYYPRVLQDIVYWFDIIPAIPRDMTESYSR
jgi:hypothetical protein